MRPARTGLGIGASRVNVQRDVPTPHGWWLGADDNGPVDGCVGVTRIEGEDGRPIVVLVNHAVQSSVMNGSVTQAGERQVTADLAGATSRRMEESYGKRRSRPLPHRRGTRPGSLSHGRSHHRRQGR